MPHNDVFQVMRVPSVLSTLVIKSIRVFARTCISFESNIIKYRFGKKKKKKKLKFDCARKLKKKNEEEKKISIIFYQCKKEGAKERNVEVHASPCGDISKIHGGITSRFT